MIPNPRRFEETSLQWPFSGILLLTCSLGCAAACSCGDDSRATVETNTRHAKVHKGLQLRYEYGFTDYVPPEVDVSERASPIPRCALIVDGIPADQLKLLKTLKSVTVVILLDMTIMAPVIDRLASCPHVKELRLYRCNVTAGVLEKVQRLSSLESIQIVPSDVQEIDMAFLKGLRNLRWLGLDYSTVRLSEFRQLANRRNIVKLSLKYSKCKGEFSFLREFKSLKSLDLRGTRFGSEDLALLTDLKALEELNLAKCPLTDNDVTALGQLRSLKVLYLHDTGVTAYAAERLRALLPDCLVSCGKLERVN